MPAFTRNGEPMPYGPFTTGEGDEAIHHPANALDLWSDQELAAHGIVREPEPPPLPVRPSVRKSTVTNRLVAAGKIADAMTALLADAAAFGRWFAPDWPNVYCDDEQVVALLTAIGADPAEILAAE